MKKFLCLLVICLFFNIEQAKAGIILTDTLEPLLISGIEVKDIGSLKCGTESITHIFGLYSTGYAGIYDIAVRNGIKRIHHVDIRKKLFLGIGSVTIRVYGE